VAGYTISREDKMKKVALMIALGLSLLPVSVRAAQVFGSLKVNGRSVSDKIDFDVACGTQKPAPGKTDGYGAYSFNAGKGKCTFTVHYQGQSPSYVIYSYDNAVRYDFDLVLQNGQYMLRRR
jgi:hypothetical protein